LEDILVIRSTGRPRQGWEKQFAEMAKNEDRSLNYESGNLTSWDLVEWDWN
jgi:hypothetical protein